MSTCKCRTPEQYDSVTVKNKWIGTLSDPAPAFNPPAHSARACGRPENPDWRGNRGNLWGFDGE
ncbi:MAG: hypothetical protein U0996_26955 [Planctomycetaceae bacterium]